MSNSPLDIARSVLQDVLSCPVLVTTDFAPTLDAFEREACLDRHLQPAFSVNYLRTFVRQMEPQVVHQDRKSVV